MEDDYFKKPGLSNSFLGCVKSGQSFKCSPETLLFGTQVHEACLEPLVYISKMDQYAYMKNAQMVDNMRESLLKNALFLIFAANEATEYEKEYFFELEGLPCKLKADLKLRDIIGDIKTTDARTREEFEKRAVEYGYHRQGAWYMDGTGSNRFIIFAIGKKFPYPTFTYVLERNSPEIAVGRAEYLQLIEKYKSLTPEQIELLKS